MPLGIDPRNDFAFQRVLGSPDHSRVTIHFLNSVLEPAEPITSVEFLNPLQSRDVSADKLAVLDVLARDERGRRFNIEMQTTLHKELPQRLTFYNCLNYTRQISKGSDYLDLRPAISICVLDRVLFPQVTPYHLSFRLRSDQADVIFCDDLAFHTLELPKFHATIDSVRELPAIDRWAFFFKHASTIDPVELSRVLGDSAFGDAIEVLQMISKSEQEMLQYEAREKFLRDQAAYLRSARQEGRQEGREEGREIGVLIGRIQMIQELLGDTPADMDDLSSWSLDELTSLAAELQLRMRSRQS